MKWRAKALVDEEEAAQVHADVVAESRVGDLQGVLAVGRIVRICADDHGVDAPATAREARDHAVDRRRLGDVDGDCRRAIAAGIGAELSRQLARRRYILVRQHGAAARLHDRLAEGAPQPARRADHDHGLTVQHRPGLAA
jgi:hypothetical protein